MCPDLRKDQGSIPLVLLASIVFAGLIVALFTDVTTGRQLAVADRDFQQAVQIADAGLQDAYAVLSRLDDPEAPALPEINAEFDEPFSATVGRGTFTWNARRVGVDSWEIRSRGAFGERARILEARMGQESLFDAAAFGDQWVRMAGGNVADSYNRDGGAACYEDTGVGYVATNELMDINPNQDIDGVILYGDADYARGTAPLIYSVKDERRLPNIARDAFRAGGKCYDREILSGLPEQLERGEVYCVENAEFPKDSTELFAEHGDENEPTEIYIRDDGRLTLAGQGGGSGGPSSVNMKGKPCPEATALQIYVDHGDVRFGNQSEIAAGIYAPNSTCRGDSSAAQASIYGSLICGSIGSGESGNQGGWSFHYDEGLGAIAQGDVVFSTVREEHDSTTSFGG